MSAGCGRSKCLVTKEDMLRSLSPTIELNATCDAFWISWYYNRKKKRCGSFSYSGCSQLGPFTSKKHCIAARCPVKVCAYLRPRLTSGFALGRVMTWYFDLATRHCQQIMGGQCATGCVFSTWRECIEARCNKLLGYIEPEDLTTPTSTFCQGSTLAIMGFQ